MNPQKKSEIPEDLGIKIGTETEALWTNVKTEAELLIKQSNNNLIIQKEMLKVAEQKIAEEQSKK